MSFFLTLFALSVPFWVIGAATGLELLPGLPVTALMTFCPAIAASILIFRQQGRVGVVRLLKRSIDYHRIPRKIWYLPALCLMPVMMLVTYWIMRWMALSLPPKVVIPFADAPVMAVGFFLAALGEELGWSGYATEPIQARWGLLGAGILLGLMWALWHFVPLIQVRRQATWIAGWSLGTVANRVIIVWLYNNAGRSVFAAALYHATSNLTWQLFPNHGSHYDPRVSGPLLALAALVVSARSDAGPSPPSPPSYAHRGSDT